MFKLVLQRSFQGVRLSPWSCITFLKILEFQGKGLLAPLLIPRVRCQPRPIHYDGIYPPYLEAVCSIRNLRTCHVVVDNNVHHRNEYTIFRCLNHAL